LLCFAERREFVEDGQDWRELFVASERPEAQRADLFEILRDDAPE
jgi:hypothetical protein